MNWFWDTMWRWFGDKSSELPPDPDDKNMRGLGWRGDRRETKPFEPKPEDIKKRHENGR